MRTGLIAQPHRTGLGIQQWEFARHMEPERVLITDLSRLHAENSRNHKVVSKVDWFDNYERMTVDGVPNEAACRWLLEGIDVLFVIETPLNWQIFEWAREMGVKSVLQYNAEFLEYGLRSVPKPDLFLAPSPWMINEVRKYGEVKYLPVPVATDRIKRREITTAEHFIHIAGHRAFADRNGTGIVTAARDYLKRCNLTIYDQSQKELPNYWDLYKEGDVLLLPRKYGGLSLQLQEASAAGIPIVVTDKDAYASEECTLTIPATEHAKLKLRLEVDMYTAKPQDLAYKINELMFKDSIERLSEMSYRWAEMRSWKRLAPAYQQVLEEA